MKVFLDTNVLLDVFDAQRDAHTASLTIFIAAEQQRLEPVITGLSLVNAEYVLGKQGVKRSDRERFVNDILLLSSTASTDGEQLRSALAGEWPDFEDAVQYHAALSSGRVQAIITSDTKGFKRSRIPVFTPEQFVNEHLQGP
jgi:predicted nucleic acid-binding protein